MLIPQFYHLTESPLGWHSLEPVFKVIESYLRWISYCYRGYHTTVLIDCPHSTHYLNILPVTEPVVRMYPTPASWYTGKIIPIPAVIAVIILSQQKNKKNNNKLFVEWDSVWVGCCVCRRKVIMCVWASTGKCERTLILSLLYLHSCYRLISFPSVLHYFGCQRVVTLIINYNP